MGDSTYWKTRLKEIIKYQDYSECLISRPHHGTNQCRGQHKNYSYSGEIVREME